ncbi:hypothetical protein CGCF413_v001365 [Colletotrichum fructicola]|nr:hypothetical protein CGCF413_v001365 [Colletotrichum fructicola]
MVFAGQKATSKRDDRLHPAAVVFLGVEREVEGSSAVGGEDWDWSLSSSTNAAPATWVVATLQVDDMQDSAAYATRAMAVPRVYLQTRSYTVQHSTAFSLQKHLLNHGTECLCNPRCQSTDSG